MTKRRLIGVTGGLLLVAALLVQYGSRILLRLERNLLSGRLGQVESGHSVTTKFAAATAARYIEPGNSVDFIYRSRVEVDLVAVLNELDGPRRLSPVSLSSTHTGSFEVSTTEGFPLDGSGKISIGPFEGFVGWVDLEVVERSSGEILQSVPLLAIPAELSGRLAYIAHTLTVDAYVDPLSIRTVYRNPYSLNGAYSRPLIWPVDFSISRSLSLSGHLIDADLNFLRWLTEQGVRYHVLDDYVVAERGPEISYQTLILGSHSEYWTDQMFELVQRHVSNGGDLLVLGGNTAFGVFERDGASLVLRERPTRGSCWDIVREYLGSFYGEAGYMTFAPFQVEEADHPLMAGLPPRFGLTTEHRMEASSEARWGDGASGHETDRRVNDEFVILAAGQNPGWLPSQSGIRGVPYSSGGAEMVFKEFPSGGRVLNVGSVAFLGALDDKGVQRFLRNALSFFELLSESVETDAEGGR